MIRGIVAIDGKCGMANDDGIPWDLPTDKKFYIDSIRTGTILMGYGTYMQLKKPYYDRVNYVATSKDEVLRDGFEAVNDVSHFLASVEGDVWNIGGPGLLAATLDTLDEFYVTQLEGDFHCTKFLPEFADKFVLASQSESMVENGIKYRFEVWKNLHKQG